MQILDFGGAQGHMIDRFESRHARHVGLAQIAGRGGVSVIRLGPGGVLGRHPAVVDQLFCIIEGRGWVSGPDGARLAVGTGQAAYWRTGEEHESGSDDGMTALVVEIEHCTLSSGIG